MMIQPIAGSDLFVYQGWQDYDWASPATALEGQSIAGVALETTLLAPWTDPRDVERANQMLINGR